MNKTQNFNNPLNVRNSNAMMANLKGQKLNSIYNKNKSIANKMGKKF